MERAAIEANNARFSSALERGEAAAMADCYTGDGLLLPPGLPAVSGRDAIEAFWRAGIEAGVHAVKLETLSLEAWGDAAVEVGRATVTIEAPDGTVIADVGKYVVVHRRQEDGSWRWAVDIFNSDAPEPAPAERS
ncbi:MAG TPA: SgcJ/EcaC family oxidoreductase [Acidimicrobiales bacterium]|jgi:uncharacterized protein (TIGR02246 family)|nr:SgcJ/EcaC family oxidoreductase [Acidimicrobiales bacterium]